MNETSEIMRKYQFYIFFENPGSITFGYKKKKFPISVAGSAK
jgi:hypothetical protein